MKYYGYNIKLKINKSVDLDDPSLYSFSLTDSIFNLLNFGTISFYDIGGHFREFLILENGNEVNVTFGRGETINKCNYNIKSNSIDRTESTNSITGEIKTKVEHAWGSADEKIKSIAYDDTISNIILKLANSYQFKNKDITTTHDRDIWYQPLLNDIDFIQQQLLPNVYSTSSSDTPLFCYTTYDNNIHLISAKEMFDKKPVKELFFTPASYKEFESMIFVLKHWTVNSDDYDNLLNQTITYIDKESGSIIEKTDKFKDHLINKSGKLFHIGDDNQAKGYEKFLYKEKGQRENIYKGQIINKLKKNYFINELMITCPYDPNLKAGETIKLNIFLSGEGKNPVRSKRLSGKYIIEASEQIWSAQLKKAFSKLLIGVPSSGTDPNIPSDYRYKELLV